MQKTVSQAAARGTIRQLRPSDLARFRDHLLRLDAESRRDRFNGLTDDEFVSSYADRCFAEGTTVIGYVEDGRVLGAAELHELANEAVPTGEIAFSVEREVQHRGIGGRLFERLILNALGLGYTRLLVTTHPQNEAMKALARRFNAVLSFGQGETRGIIDLDVPASLNALAAAARVFSTSGAGEPPNPGVALAGQRSRRWNEGRLDR
ncbi:MAG: GNAT family N-acetyltransferase [Pseudaminobacter sp.]|nr:GNAT family N-acetyltransferase [Pseudaminobacter sp.]